MHILLENNLTRVIHLFWVSLSVDSLTAETCNGTWSQWDGDHLNSTHTRYFIEQIFFEHKKYCLIGVLLLEQNIFVENRFVRPIQVSASNRVNLSLFPLFKFKTNGTRSTIKAIFHLFFLPYFDLESMFYFKIWKRGSPARGRFVSAIKQVAPFTYTYLLYLFSSLVVTKIQLHNETIRWQLQKMYILRIRVRLILGTLNQLRFSVNRWNSQSYF